MREIEPGVYKARAVKSSVQVAYPEGKAPYLSLDLEIPSLGNQVVDARLYFSQNAAKWALLKLQVLGWKGKTIAELADLSGLGDKQADIEVTREYRGDRHWNNVDIKLPSKDKKLPEAAVDMSTFISKVSTLLGSHAEPLSHSDEEDNIPF